MRPAIQAQKAGLSYDHLAKAIAATLLFDYKDDEDAVKLQSMMNEHGVSYVLQQVCGLDESSELARKIIRHYEGLKG